jgi:hypothetical protein
MAITSVAYGILTSEDRRHTLQIGVSVGVPSRRVPGSIVLLSVLNGKVLMAVRQQSVIFAGIVVVHFIQFQYVTERTPRRLNDVVKVVRLTQSSRQPSRTGTTGSATPQAMPTTILASGNP